MTSQTTTDGFGMVLDVDKWAGKDRSPSAWSIPLQERAAAATPAKAGTRITVTKLNDDTSLSLGSDAFVGRLLRQVATTYAFFLRKFIDVYVNGILVHPQEVSFGDSEDYDVAVDEATLDDVYIKVLCGLVPKGPGGDWKSEDAGWYILCNGRIVLAADKTWKTGWGEGLPNYHTKYRHFAGLVFFHSDDALRLPWTTTKRDVNTDSRLYQHARGIIILAAKPVLTFLNRMYPTEVAAEVDERAVAERVKPADLKTAAAAKKSPFLVRVNARPARKVATSVQYHAPDTDLKKIRSHVGKPRLPAGQIGELTFKYYLEMEGLLE